jgi:uncharacterized protein (UPF0333 family)
MGIKNMSTTIKVIAGLGIGMVVFVVMLAIALVSMYVGANNYAANTEAAIEARYKDRQNVFSNYGQKVAEAAQVPAMYRDDLTKVMTSAITSRYGADGSKAPMQWLKEANIPFDASMYTKIQQIIEAGRNDFQAAQTAQLDICRQYEGQQGTIPRGWFIRMAGYPKVDMAHCQPITDDRTDAAFQSGKQETIKLR